MRPSGPEGMPLVSLRPGAAGVAGLVDAAAGAATVEAPGRATPLVGGGVQHLVVRGVLHQLGGAGVLVDEEDVGPRQAAIGGLEDAALLAGPPEAAERGDVDDVVIDGVDDDACDVLRIAKPHVLPRLCRHRSTCRRRCPTSRSGDCCSRRCRPTPDWRRPSRSRRRQSKRRRRDRRRAPPTSCPCWWSSRAHRWRCPRRRRPDSIPAPRDRRRGRPWWPGRCCGRSNPRRGQWWQWLPVPGAGD